MDCATLVGANKSFEQITSSMLLLNSSIILIEGDTIIQKSEYIGRITKAIRLVINNLLVNRRHTYCRYLWESVFIHKNGDVYICCHYGPGKIGNIYKHNLSKIWEKSIRLKLFRLLSLNKCLYCFFECNIISADEKRSSARSLIYIKYPKGLRILIGEFCNLNCIMCGQDHRSKEAIDNKIIKENIDWTRVEEIDFLGGEILAMKNAKELYLWLTKTVNKKVNLITNGLLINDEWAYHLVNGSNWIEISVNAATEATHELVNRKSNFVRVINNIKKLIDLKQQHGSDVKITYKYTIVPENIHEVADAIELAENLGCDHISYGYDYSVINILKQNNELRRKLKNQIFRLVNSDLKLTVNVMRLEYLNLI